MTSYPLDRFLSGHVFAFVFIFARIGSIMMIMPGIAETYVSPRIRLFLAFSISFLLLGPLYPRLPPPPEAIPDMTKMLAYEILIGLFFGTILRMLISTLESAGTVISLQTGLSNATILNPALATQSPLPSAFLSTLGATLIFVTGLDQMLFRSMVALYDVFPPAGTAMPGDIAQSVIRIMNQSFVIGVELTMPFMVMGMLMYMALGLMQKLLPQVQLFLVVLPLQIWGGMVLFSATIAGIMTVWLRYFDSTLASLFSR